MKVVRSSEENSSTQFEVWESTGDNTYDVASVLPNPTLGENGTGVPHSEIGDFDNDGKMEILLGDSDGDLYIYESTGDNLMDSIWQERMPLQDTIDFLSCGDYDGDGQLEFVAGCHTDPKFNTEHEYDARHCFFRVYDTDGDNSYIAVAEWYFFGFESPKSFDSGVSSGDVDGDGFEEILICVFPDFYIIDYDPISAEYAPSWYAWSIQSNAAIVADADNDGFVEFYINDGDQVKSYRSLGPSTGPATPIGIDAHPLDQAHVLVIWEVVIGAEQYSVYRGTTLDGLNEIASISSTNFIDSTVAAEQTYWYAVIAHDMDKTPSESRMSEKIKVKPGPRPFVVSASAITDQDVRVVFSEFMNESVKNSMNYRIENAMGRPSSVIHDKSGREAILSFGEQFPVEGDYTLFVTNVKDINRTPIDTNRSSVQFTVEFTPSLPYLVNGCLIKSNLLELEFNEPMDEKSCNVTTNYDLGSEIDVINAWLVNPEKVHLKLSSKVPIGALGTGYTVKVRSVKSAKGLAIRSGRGDRITLIFSRPDVSQAFVFPNPFRPDLGRNTITFANLTKTATVRVITLDGRTIKTLKEYNGDGGVEWDLRDENGNLVSSGVYFFLATGNGHEKLGKFAILR